MTNEELAVLIQAGERNRIPELWERVERFVSMQAGKRARQLDGFGGVTEEDLYQSGFLALLGAAESYDPNKGKTFIGWLELHLKNSFAEAAGYRNKRRDVLDFADDLDAPIAGTDDLTEGDYVEDPSAAQQFEKLEFQMWREQLHASLENTLQILPAAWADILRCRYFQDKTFAETSAAKGVGIEMVRQREAQALRRLRQAPRVMRELRQFIEEQTPYYTGTSLRSFRNYGSQPERVAILREEKAEAFLRQQQHQQK